MKSDVGTKPFPCRYDTPGAAYRNFNIFIEIITIHDCCSWRTRFQSLSKFGCAPVKHRTSLLRQIDLIFIVFRAESLRLQAIAAGVVFALSGAQPDAVGRPTGHDAKAVVFYFVQPQLARGRAIDLYGKAWKERTQHCGGI